MATINEDLFSNIMRTNMNHLKSFAETLNAEIAEIEQDDDGRSRYKDDFQRILHSFAEGEAFFQKNHECLKQVQKKLQLRDNEQINQQDIEREIKNIIKTVEGTEHVTNEEQSLPDVDRREFHLAEHLERVMPILDEFNPLKLEDDDEGDEEEEEKQSKRLERMQKKAMKKLETKMSKVHENDHEDSSALLKEDINVSDSSDEGEIDYENAYRPKNVHVQSQEKTRRNIDIKLKDMFDNYRKRLADNKSVDIKQVFDEMSGKARDVPFENLSIYSPKNNETIMEMFGNEAILVVKSKDNFVDPISKKEIENPVRNKKCHHVYEKETMFDILRKKKQMRCPMPGCSRQAFTIEDLEDDEETAAKISQRISQRASASQLDTEDMDTDDVEVHNTTIDSERDDTQSQDDTQDDTQSQALF